MARVQLRTVVAKLIGAEKVVEEGIADAAGILPGHLIQLMSTGNFRVHPNASQNVTPAKFALEDEMQGKTVDDAYAISTLVQVWTPSKGDWVRAILADGETIVINDAVESAGDGTLQKYVADTVTDSSGQIETIYPNPIVGIAREALDLSNSSAAESSGITGDQALLIEII